MSDGQQPPDGWEAHHSRTFSRYYLYNPATNAVCWTAEQALGLDGVEPPSTDEGHAALPHAEEAEENVDYFDFGDKRIGFPRHRPEAAPYLHGWVYPPMVELLQRLCSEDTAVILELGAWLGLSTRQLVQLAPQVRSIPTRSCSAWQAANLYASGRDRPPCTRLITGITSLFSKAPRYRVARSSVG